MFKLSQKHVFHIPILKFEYIRNTPPSLNLVNGKNIQSLLMYPEKIVRHGCSTAILKQVLM